MATTFEMALDHFWRAQQARTDEERTLQLASGLQLFCVAVQESVRNPDNDMFQMAVDHFWRSQQAGMRGNQSELLLQMSTGLQQFCAATKDSI